MPSANHTTKLPELTIPTYLADRMRKQMTLRNESIRQTEAYIEKLPASLRARHAALVNATKTHQDAAAVIAFYQNRYNVSTTPTVAPYTHDAAIADAQSAGLSYADAHAIVRKAIAANVQGAEYRAFIDAHVDMRKAEIAALRDRQAATLARVRALQAVGA